MSDAARLIAEARTSGVHLAFDGDRLCVYAHEPPSAALISALRVHRPAIYRLLRAEEAVLRKALALDWRSQEFGDLTANEELGQAVRELLDDLASRPDKPIDGPVCGWESRVSRLLKLPSPPPYGGKPVPAADDELACAKERLTRVIEEFPTASTPTWDDFKPLEESRLDAFHSGDEQRALEAVQVWEHGIVDLLELPARDQQPPVTR